MMARDTIEGRSGPIRDPVRPGEPPLRFATRRAWLYGAAVIPLMAALRHLLNPAELAVDVAALGLLLSANGLLGAGLRAEDAFRARPSARRPALPLKLLAALLTGAGVAVAFSSLGAGFMAVYGLTAALLHLAAFGIDPLRHKESEGADLGAAERTELHLAAARGWLAEIDATLAGLKDADLTRAGRAFGTAVRHLLALVQRRPAALNRQREHLGVLLHGARDAALRLADVWDGAGRAEAKAEFLHFLNDLQSSYEERAKTLESALHQEMNLEMDVVRDRLKSRAGRDSDTLDSED